MDRPKRFESLDGLRGVCALMVAIRHCELVGRRGVLNHAYLSVDAFFVISGFVIAFAYEKQIAEGLPLSAFLRVRARRLLPTHIIGTSLVLAVYFCVFPVDPRSAFVAAILALLLLPDFHTHLLFPITRTLWSLTDEWIVNLFYAAPRRRIHTFAVWFIALLCWGALVVHCLERRTRLDIGMSPDDFIWGVLRASGGFFAGVGVCRLHAAGRLQSLPNLMPELLYAICFFFAAVPLSVDTPLFDLGVMMTFPLVVAILARSDRQPSNVFKWLGRVSYPLYVSQFAAVYLASAALGSESQSSRLVLFPSIAATLAIAWITERLVNRANGMFRQRENQAGIKRSDLAISKFVGSNAAVNTSDRPNAGIE